MTGKHIRHGCLALLVVAAGAASARELPRKQFEIRVEATGTRLGRTAMRSELPLNRRYAELDDAEKAVLRADYEDMPAADEPPFPAEGLLPIFKALKDGMEKVTPLGGVTLVADVDTEGRVRHVDASGSVHPTFARFAAQVLVATPFKPGVCSGKPCNMQYALRMRFSTE